MQVGCFDSVSMRQSLIIQKHRRCHSVNATPYAAAILQTPPIIPALAANQIVSHHRSSTRRFRSISVQETVSFVSLPEIYSFMDIDPEETTSNQQHLQHHHQIKSCLKKSKSMPALVSNKQFRFNETVYVGEAHSSDDYERKSDFQLRLTAELAYMIKRELNEFKSNEMPVHEESKKFTHIFKL